MINRSNPTPNTEFIKRWNRGDQTPAILESEASYIDNKLQRMDRRLQKIVADKMAVTGGDDWHDGAFRATDSEANALAEQREGLLQARRLEVVEKPLPSSVQVSLGSRALIVLNGGKKWIDIVGTSMAYERDGSDKVILATLQSPVGSTLIGRDTGDIFQAFFANRKSEIEVVETMPMPGQNVVNFR